MHERIRLPSRQPISPDVPVSRPDVLSARIRSGEGKRYARISPGEVIQGIMEHNYAPPQTFIDEERELLSKLRKEGVELQPSSLAKMTIDRVNEPLIVKTRRVCLQCRQPHDFTLILNGNGVFGPPPICKQCALAGRKQRIEQLETLLRETKEARRRKSNIKSAVERLLGRMKLSPDEVQEAVKRIEQESLQPPKPRKRDNQTAWYTIAEST